MCFKTCNTCLTLCSACFVCQIFKFSCKKFLDKKVGGSLVDKTGLFLTLFHIKHVLFYVFYVLFYVLNVLEVKFSKFDEKIFWKNFSGEVVTAFA